MGPGWERLGTSGRSGQCRTAGAESATLVHVRRRLSFRRARGVKQRKRGTRRPAPWMHPGAEEGASVAGDRDRGTDLGQPRAPVEHPQRPVHVLAYSCDLDRSAYICATTRDIAYGS